MRLLLVNPNTTASMTGARARGDPHSDPTTVDPIGDLCSKALDSDGSRSIVLGCAAMARFAEPLRRRLDAPVIDGVVAATVLAEALVALTPP